jgi:thiol-disulfide isomerase/thioredoxin
MEITQGGGLPDPAAGFRLDKSEKKPEDLPMMLSMSAFSKPTIGGFRILNNVPQLLLLDKAGSSVVSFDPKTSLITMSKMKLTPPGAPPEFTLDITFSFKPMLLEKLPAPITFDPGDRERVSAADQLGPQPVKIGEDAPVFTLASLEGQEVSLADLKGEIVVIDFWATWCGPCRKGLPEIQKVATWVKEQKLPVKVFAVDVWEEGSVEEKTAKVKKFWTDQKFTFSTLLDLDDKVVAQYGLSGIPATFVIGRDGKIIGYHGGFDPGMADTLKKELLEAVQEKG